VFSQQIESCKLGHSSERPMARPLDRLATPCRSRAIRKADLIFYVADSLAVMLLDGDGVKQDNPAGMRWLRRAARRGDSKAQYNLGRAYADGNGVRKSVTYAEKWLSKAAGSGHAKARRLLESLRRKLA